MPEQQVRREYDARLLGAGDDFDRLDRRAAEVEEVVVDADGPHAQNVRPYRRESLLEGRAGGHLMFRGRHLRRDLRKGRAVDLAVDRQRHGVERHDRRQHVGRQPAPQVVAQRVDLERRRVARDHEPREARPSGRVVADDDGGIGHVRVGADHLLDLVRLDAVSADLYLMVDPAQKLEVSVLAPADEVAGAVHRRAFLAGVGVGDESLGGQRRLIQIAHGQGRAAQAEFARHADGDELEMPVADVGHRQPDGLADGRRGAVGGGDGERRADRDFGGAVGVDEPPPRCPARDQFGGARLARDDERPQRGEDLRGHRRQDRRRDNAGVDAPIAEQAEQARSRQHLRGRRHDEAPADRQR